MAVYTCFCRCMWLVIAVYDCIYLSIDVCCQLQQFMALFMPKLQSVIGPSGEINSYSSIHLFIPHNQIEDNYNNHILTALTNWREFYASQFQIEFIHLNPSLCALHILAICLSWECCQVWHPFLSDQENIYGTITFVCGREIWVWKWSDQYGSRHP